MEQDLNAAAKPANSSTFREELGGINRFTGWWFEASSNILLVEKDGK